MKISFELFFIIDCELFRLKFNLNWSLERGYVFYMKCINIFI